MKGAKLTMSTQDIAVSLVERGNSIEIETEADYLHVGEFLKSATALERNIQAHYAPLKASAHQLHAQICEAERTQLAPVQNVIARVKGLCLGWMRRQKELAEAQQRELQAKADAARKAGAVVVPQAQVQASIPKISGLSGRVRWKAVIDDPALLPREYLMPDQVKLNQAANRMGAHFSVAGAHSEIDENIVIRNP